MVGLGLIDLAFLAFASEQFAYSDLILDWPYVIAVILVGATLWWIGTRE